MKIINVILILTLSKLSFCQDIKNYGYLYIRHDGKVETLNRKFLKNELKDSVFHIQYVEYNFKNDTDTFDFFLPKNNKVIQGIRLVDTKIIYNNFGSHIVYKYLFDFENASDEEMLIFYNPQFGILIHKFAAWGDYYRMIFTESVDLNKFVFYLCDKIISDESFFSN